MSDLIRQANPSPEEQQQMVEFANLIGEAMLFMNKYIFNLDLQYAMKAVQESMFWFHSYILKGGKLLPPQTPENAAPPAETLN